jgi:hypothetical protein
MSSDISTAREGAHIEVGQHGGDSIRWRPVATVQKYDDDQTAWVARKTGVAVPQGAHFEAAGVKPYDTVVAPGNLLTTAGLTRLTSLLTGGGGQALTATSGRLGVGNSSTAAAVGQTDLQAAAGAANRWFMPLDNATPTVAAGVVTLRATFATGDANFVWAEWGVDIGTPTVAASAVVNATLLNRAVQALGTKASGSWVLTTTITIS